MPFFAFLNPFPPVAGRTQAERAAEASAGVWLIIAILFGFGAIGSLASPHVGGAGLPAWTIFLGLTIAATGIAAFVNRRKSVLMAIATLIAATVMSLYAVVALLAGKGAMVLVPPMLLALALRGHRGARALRAFGRGRSSPPGAPNGS
jgi:hypothetical protein